MSRIDDILLEELGRTRAEIQSRIVAEGKEASGKTRQSMQEVALGSQHAGIEGFQYSGVMERGRLPGRVPADFVQKLTEWATVKGIASRFTSAAEFHRFIYNTHQAIKTEGFNRAFTKDIFATPLENLANRLPLVLADEYVSEITNKVFEWR